MHIDNNDRINVTKDKDTCVQTFESASQEVTEISKLSKEAQLKTKEKALLTKLM